MAGVRLPVSRCRLHCRVPVERGRRKHCFADGAHVHADCARQHGSASATLIHAAPCPLQPDVYLDSVLLMTCFSLLLYFQMLYFNLSLSLCQLYWHRRCHDALHIRVQPVEGSIELMLRVARSSIVAAATDIIVGGCSSRSDSAAKQHALAHHLREYSRGDGTRVAALVHHCRQFCGNRKCSAVLVFRPFAVRAPISSVKA